MSLIDVHLLKLVHLTLSLELEPKKKVKRHR